jgi:mannose-6-phosphate isomerase-like protein (cupin superfamily)
MGFRASSLDELGDGYGFRKVRAPLDVTAFGVNFLVYPPGYEGIGHYHDRQDELYLVHRGRARFEVDGETFELGEGGVVHVEATTPRRVSNAADGDLVLLIVGGKDGYVPRDGHVISEEDGERRRAMSEGRMER